MKSLPSHISYIGADDDNLDLFEGQYPVPGGISYNSYLIDDDKIAVVDSVDSRRCEEWLSALKMNLPEGRKPDYLIVQHVEPDHSGSVKAMLSEWPGVRIVCTAKAAAMLANFFEGIDFPGITMTVGEGDTLSLGRTLLKFHTAPMVHWPEVMITLDETDGVLFTADAFGSFAMSSDSPAKAWPDEARRYYCNIVGRFGPSVQALMKKVSGLKFNTIAPLHGPVLSGNLGYYWTLYDKWSRYEAESDGVLVAYASIYGGTAEAAGQLAAELRRCGTEDVVLMDLCRHDVSYAVAEAFRLSRMALCSVTYDGSLFPAMSNFLHHIDSKKLSGRRVALIENGSWAPVAARLMTEALGKMKDMTVVSPVLSIRSRLHNDDIPTLKALASSLTEG